MENGVNISLLQYYNQHFTSFCHQYRKPKLRLSKKVIHQLRVDIKNMRAIFDLLKIIRKENCPEERHISVFENLFQAAGKVREEQVNLSILGRFEFSPSLALYKKYLIKRKRSGFWALHKALKEFNLGYSNKGRQELKSHIESANQNEIVTQIQNFILKGIKKIKKLYPDLPAKNLHKIRKDLKVISTITFFLYEISPNKGFTKNPAKIKQIEILMGVWHNRLIFISSIEQFLTRDESFPELMMLQKLLRSIKIQNKKTIKQIDKRMGKLFG